VSDFTGYDPTIENRDWLQSASTSIAFTSRDYQAPEEIDPRERVRHDKQFDMGSCGGFGNTSSAENIWAMHYDGKFSSERQFSPLFSYLEAQRFDGLLGSDRGSTISSGVKVGMTIGYLPAKHLPYKTPYPRDARTLITDAMRKEAEPYRIRSHTWLENYDAIFNYLASGAGSVFPGTPWNDSFYARGGVLESVSFTARDGGHAYAFLGYSRRKDSRGRNYLWRLNSHQDSWTEIAPSVIDALCKHQHTSIVGISDLTTPGPRKIKWIESRPLG